MKVTYYIATPIIIKFDNYIVFLLRLLGKYATNTINRCSLSRKKEGDKSEGTEKVPIFNDQNGKCLRFITSPSTNRLSKAMLDRKRRVKLRFLRH